MLPFSEACERNKAPILGVLKTAFADRSHVLEIGSGTGQHAVYFAHHLPHLTWHPTELSTGLANLAKRIKLEGGPNLSSPELLDVRQEQWPLRSVDAIFTANTFHIMSWPEVIATYRGVGVVLCAGGVMCIYGPFRYGGQYTSESNRQFDRTLRERNPESGLRDIELIVELANTSGLTLVNDHDLPANNRLLVFRKADPGVRNELTISHCV